ncbi:hypothetical protein N9102_00885 [bacterium]|nr:hypothetical protein [bacterium]
MVTDNETTLTDVKQIVSRFVEERDWLQYHDPKNLVMAMMSEVEAVLVDAVETPEAAVETREVAVVSAAVVVPIRVDEAVSVAAAGGSTPVHF